jgi:glycosyltransferase involved in cell wall biosynthesis
MEIIHLILGKANPERMNGVNKVVHEMATNQVQHGYPVQVWGITAHPEHDYPDRIFTTRLFQAYRNPFRLDATLKQALLDHKGRVVVHIHGAFIPVFYTLSRFLDDHTIPFIITPHSTYNRVMMKKNALLKKIYFRFFEKRLLDRSSFIHLLGKSEWIGLGDIYHNRKSVILPYGFTRQQVRDTPKKPSGFSVVYCGRLAAHHKGLDILLNGFALFNRKYPDARLMLIGDGREKKALKELSGLLGIEASVTFMGSVFGTDKNRILQECDVFAHPSRTDGLPATIVEACALGLPCVVSEATNMGEILEKHDAGYKMKSLDPAELDMGLTLIYNRIVKKGHRALLKANAFNMIDTDFCWTGVLRQLNNIYQQTLQTSTNP